MALTLVVNPGSTSKKFALYNDERVVFSARFEKTADGAEMCVEAAGERAQCEDVAPQRLENAIEQVVNTVLADGFAPNREAIRRVGLRVVAPGTYFQEHRLVDDTYVAELQDRSPLAPLHTPVVLREIAAIQDALPKAKIIGVSDSAFHASKWEEATHYTIEPADAERYDIHRYGYHGVSVASIARRLPAFCGDVVPERAVVCHLGGGASITALKRGVSVDTTMGYSPESGLIMNSRAGDVDAGALLALMHEKRLQPFDAHVYLSTRGGFAGRLGNGDLRYALDRAALDDERAVATLDQYAYYIKKTIGAYYAVLGGLDAVVLTGSAPFRNPDVRSLVLGELDALGINLAVQRNHDLVGAEGTIEANGAAVKVVVMKTDEMGEIARVTQDFS